eukprot:CAMPEP_0172473830 /NCGR_PEP_ID=MMETSP1065-20121228/69054_1 /TAXON_ID=265537 /ORGANISM="Amphiprora paludosa, Strain CCMP125" /LENGTH=128 /DNA_ID=CAMNT_0013232007 /DNA_START=330 /DNA_END=716 /DNA_ORIENTATION=+
MAQSMVSVLSNARNTNRAVEAFLDSIVEDHTDGEHQHESLMATAIEEKFRVAIKARQESKKVKKKAKVKVPEGVEKSSINEECQDGYREFDLENDTDEDQLFQSPLAESKDIAIDDEVSEEPEFDVWA